MKEVPYSRLVETNLSTKLDSDSKLQCEISKLTVTGEGIDLLPKNSVSDSKLAVDYFNSPTEVRKSPVSQNVSNFEIHSQIALTVCFRSLRMKLDALSIRQNRITLWEMKN